jgi:regulator of replication initiation timing
MLKSKAYNNILNSRLNHEEGRAMAKRRKPKFEIGDAVVITSFGTTGEITDIKWIDGNYYYEITKDGLFLEERLQLLSEYEGQIIEKEQIDIEYQFFFGDIVQVKGYGSDLFKIVGFRTEIWRYKEDAWEDVIYELSRITDGEWLEAAEEELTLVADAEQADSFIKNLSHLYMDNKNETLKLPAPKKIEKTESKKENHDHQTKKKEVIDNLLDVYNDYQILAKMFEDPEYEKIKRGILRKLKRLLNTDP